jgi:hypothetical protein
MKKETKKKKIERGEIIVAQEPREISAESLIFEGIQNGMPVETMEKLLAMRRELKAEQAKREYDIAMANFQDECPIIKNKKSVPTKSGKIAYSYAPIETIVEIVKPILTKHGFSYSIKTATTPEMVTATCISKHTSGHSEETSFSVERGSRTDVMSNSQVTAAALSFATRYALRNAFGITTAGEDREEMLKKGDGADDKMKAIQTALKSYKTEKQLEDLREKLVGSDKYTDEEKEKIMDMIDVRVSELGK